MDRFVASLRTSGDRFAAAIRRGPIDAPVFACPGWSLADLTAHMGRIHRYARLAVLTAAVPDEQAIDRSPEAADAATLATWLESGLDALVAALAGLDPAAPTWHPFLVPRVAALWPRRQAHETQVHAWDAERAVGQTSPLEPDIAADGIAEYFEVIAPHVVHRFKRGVPVGVLAIDCTDTATRLLVRTPDASTVLLEREPGPTADVDAQLGGTAEQLLLALWNRAELPARSASPLARQWLAFGGT